MDSKANYSLVGLISLLVAIVGAGFIYFFAVSDSQVETKQYIIVFTGAVNGLSNGTDVLFNGIKVGSVRALAIDPQDPGKVIGRIEIDMSAPVKVDTKALLEFQGITGVGYVQLSGGSKDSPPLLPQEGEALATIVADKSDFQNILEGVRDTIGGASIAFDRLNGFLDDNEAKASATMSNIEAFSGALAANSEGVDAFLESLSEAGQEIGPLAVELKQLSADLRGLIGDVEPGEIADIVANVSEFTDSLTRNAAKVDGFFDSATQVANNLEASSRDVNTVVAKAAEIADGIDTTAVSTVIANLGRFSDVLGRNSENTETFMTNMTGVSTTLAESVQQVQSIVARIDEMAADADGEGLFTQLAEAATAIETLATNLDARTAEITTGITGFTDSGLSEYSALASDARATLRQLTKVLGNISENPQSLIFGGETVRDYNKR